MKFIESYVIEICSAEMRLIDRGNFGREEIDRGELGTDNVRKDQSPDLTESHQALPLPHEDMAQCHRGWTRMNLNKFDRDKDHIYIYILEVNGKRQVR